jgi:cob(I)alamin adenosyltransferase
MALYTKTGDGGFTQWPDGQRLRKSDPRLEAIGCLDELNAHLGLCVQAAGAGEARAVQREVADALSPLQAELLALGAMLVVEKAHSRSVPWLEEAAVSRMEGQIDFAWAKAGQLKRFIVPGGCELACRLQVARTVCRRAERAVVALADSGGQVPALVFQYLNRLGDLLFAMARLANRNAGISETTWQG